MFITTANKKYHRPPDWWCRFGSSEPLHQNHLCAWKGHSIPAKITTTSIAIGVEHSLRAQNNDYTEICIELPWLRSQRFEIHTQINQTHQSTKMWNNSKWIVRFRCAPSAQRDIALVRYNTCILIDWIHSKRTKGKKTTSPAVNCFSSKKR